MKILNTLSLIILLTSFMVTSYAQSPRMVFVEEGTQASCPPCATANPPLQATLNQNTDKAVFIAYQVSWPGVDAMNADNPTEVADRISYYGIDGVPDAVVQGTKAPGYEGPSYVTQSLIDQIYGEMSEFDMTLDAAIQNGVLTLNGKVTATMPVSGDMKLRIAILEEHIVDTDLAYPGTNGESEFHHVFKKFVNGSAGTTLAADWAVGDTYTITETFDLSALNIYNYDELEVVAFIQNDDDKFVYQAVEDTEIEITTDFANNAGISSVTSLPENVCRTEQEVSPVFNLQNNGSAELTSATITYNVNDGPDQTYDWTGSLVTLDNESVTLPAISFVPIADDNTVNITVSAPNGEVDEVMTDNIILGQMTSLVAYDELTIEILTDNYGDEVYWEIRNSAGDIAIFGGNPNVGLTNINTGTYPPNPHPDMYGNNTLYTESLVLDASECYTFHITDYYGDGMSLSATPAYYRVTSTEGVLVVNGGNESFPESLHDFQGDMSVGVEDVIAVNSINIFPNPAQDLATIDFKLIDRVDVAAISVANAIGQQIYMQDLGTLTVGSHTQQLDLATLPNGLYLVQIELDNEVITRKITVTK